jgi:predicted alpha/beta-hydrolase family hydrolase
MYRGEQSSKFFCLILLGFFLLFFGFGCDRDTPGCGSDITPGSGDGSYQTTQDLSTGPSGDSGLWYPVNTGNNVKLPIFLWGCGGGSQPRAYVDHMNKVASYGFVIIAEVSTGTGRELRAAYNWLVQQNNNSRSPLYQKLDISKVAAGGHSMGSVSTFQVANADFITTTIHVAGGSLDGRGGGTSNLRNPTAFICGENDQMGATDNAAVDFRVASVPVFFGVMRGVDHIMAARDGLPAIISWLRWHLKGEDQLSSEFLTPNGAFQTGIWNSQTKNW